MSQYDNAKINARERIVLILVIFLVKMLKPWEYDHQFTGFWAEIKLALELDRQPEEVAEEVAKQITKNIAASSADNF